jgi:hypothetical protein
MVETNTNKLTRERIMKHAYRFFVIAFIAASMAYSQPKISLDKLEIDLGIVYSGTPKKGKIEYKNIGGDTLRVKVQPTCGCTTIKPPKAYLLSGESDFVEFEFISTHAGKTEKYINVLSNDSLSPTISVKFVADVQEELVPINHSSPIWVGNIDTSKTSTLTTFFRNASNHPIKIKGYTVSSPSITVKMEKRTLQRNDTLEVQVTIKPERPGSHNDSFTIETDSRNQSRLEMKVSYIGTK